MVRPTTATWTTTATAFADADDIDPLNAYLCGDSDGDGCDDCGVAGYLAPENDGTDTDADGLCDAGDPDDDNDGITDYCDADFPLVIADTELKQLAADGAANDSFGTSVSIAGGHAVVGATGNDDNGSNSGSAYIFVNNHNGTWSKQAKLIADDGAAYDYFGTSVSLDGDYAVVGAWKDDDNGHNSGSAYLFVNNHNGSWSQQDKLTAEDGAGGDGFGYSVSLDGDHAVVSAYGNDGYSGSAYIFVNNHNGSWSQQDKLIADDGAADDQFGISVSLDGDHAVVGAYYDDDNGSKSGSAYIFVNNHNGSWSQQDKLTAEDGAADDYFGQSVLDRWRPCGRGCLEQRPQQH